MKYFALLLLILLPFGLAHEGDTQEELPDYQSLYASTNSFDGVNPILYLKDGNILGALASAGLWIMMAAGVWELIKLVVSRFVLIQE